MLTAYGYALAYGSSGLHLAAATLSLSRVRRRPWLLKTTGTSAPVLGPTLLATHPEPASATAGWA